MSKQIEVTKGDCQRNIVRTGPHRVEIQYSLYASQGGQNPRVLPRFTERFSPSNLSNARQALATHRALLKPQAWAAERDRRVAEADIEEALLDVIDETMNAPFGPDTD